MNLRPTLVALAVALTGCATVKVSQPSQVSEKVGQIPALESTSEVTVGSTIFSQFRYWSKTGYRLSSPVSTGFMLGRVRADAGDFVVQAEVDGGTAYCTEKPAYSDLITPPIKPACFVDTTASGTFDTVKAAPGMVWLKTKLDSPVRYEQSELQVPRPDSKKYELLYQGISSKTLRLSYREYINDFARPAFFQDVTYDVPDLPTTITFRTVRIKLLSADNNGLRYQVLSGF